jgi:hypothetical protein
MMLIIWPFGLFVLGGSQCPTTQSITNTVELLPLDSATVNKLVHDNNEDEPYCTGLQQYGTFKGLAPGPAMVGYYRKHDDGTEPFACWWWVASVDRGLIRFDVASLGVPADRITAATLEFDLSTAPGVCPDDILSSIWIVNEQWSDKFNLAADFMTDSTPLPTCTPNHHSISVSTVVRDWIGGARPNYGFLFIGGNENLPANGSGERTTTLTNVKLKVLYAVPVTP